MAVEPAEAENLCAACPEPLPAGSTRKYCDVCLDLPDATRLQRAHNLAVQRSSTLSDSIKAELQEVRVRHVAPETLRIVQDDEVCAACNLPFLPGENRLRGEREIRDGATHVAYRHAAGGCDRARQRTKASKATRSTRREAILSEASHRKRDRRRAAVTEFLRDHGPSSRSLVAQRCDIPNGSYSSFFKAMIADGLIEANAFSPNRIQIVGWEQPADASDSSTSSEAEKPEHPTHGQRPVDEQTADLRAQGPPPIEPWPTATREEEIYARARGEQASRYDAAVSGDGQSDSVSASDTPPPGLAEAAPPLEHEPEFAPATSVHVHVPSVGRAAALRRAGDALAWAPREAEPADESAGEEAESNGTLLATTGHLELHAHDLRFERLVPLRETYVELLIKLAERTENTPHLSDLLGRIERQLDRLEPQEETADDETLPTDP